MGNDNSRADALEGKVKRQAITPQMKIDCLLYRGDHKCPICGEPLIVGVEIEWDHVQALVHGGEHWFGNLRPLHESCHLEKTKRDIQANAKVKRLRGETCNGPKKKIQSPGFQEPPPGYKHQWGKR